MTENPKPIVVEAQPPPTAKLAEALAKAQGKFRSVGKDREVEVQSEKGRYRFRYATLAAIWEVVRGPLAENGLAVVQLPTVSRDDHVTVETRLIHSSGESITAVCTVPIVKATAQGVGSAISYARRYGLSAMLGVVSEDEDDDANEASGNDAQVRPAPGAGVRPAPTQTAALKAKLAEPKRMQIQDEPPPPTDADAPPHDGETGEVREPRVEPSDVAIPFGKAKGQPISSATDKDLDFLRKYAKDAIQNPDKARFRDDNSRLLRAVESEIAARTN